MYSPSPASGAPDSLIGLFYASRAAAGIARPGSRLLRAAESIRLARRRSAIQIEPLERTLRREQIEYRASIDLSTFGVGVFSAVTLAFLSDRRRHKSSSKPLDTHNASKA